MVSADVEAAITPKNQSDYSGALCRRPLQMDAARRWPNAIVCCRS